MGRGADPQQLSDARAAAVADRLSAHGVAADHISARGAWNTNPLPSPDASRRAELTVS